MLYGIMVGDEVRLVADASQGREVVTADAPADVPAGFVARCSWVDGGTSIRQVWSIEPEAGTAQEATVALARMQAASLDDADALKVAALYPEWAAATQYAKGERLLWQGALYRVLQDHLSAANWLPGEATSLYAPVLAGQSGEVGEWSQPDSTNGYAKGDRVTHNGATWESLADDNVWEPGATGTESLWKQVNGN